ncbi:hypothetical protein IQ268_10410 [Oculatella sp. LEGE 06141]|uniref:hypothetical protein n=1 Tax=Oculatella sp. LEGE 06141 TaxID=1828648 RepID=UPI00187E7842|nr:hypothetical protein [Oculatella sp. LEGE 06141]MBE9178973.1 hypothetical protein [Oculatella sp. LEGE 06141]
MLTNLDLMRTFVQSSLQNQDVLLANPELQAQTVCNNNQLTAKKEGVLAIAKLKETPPHFLVKAGTSSWEWMNQVLAEHNFLLTGEADKNSFYQFRTCQVPQGYRMHCTKSVILWRAWWKYSRHAAQLGIPLDLLIRTRASWYPIRDLVISNGVLYIKTLGTELQVHADDLITWLSKTKATPQEFTQPSARPAR